MESNENISLVKEIIDRRVESFLKEIRKRISVDNIAIGPRQSDFPIFEPANQDFFNYSFYEAYLEWRIRETLIDGIFFDLFRLFRIKFKWFIKKDNVIRSTYSNSEFGEDYLFPFIINTGSYRIAYRYSSISIDERRLKRILCHYGIDHIEVIDWDNTESLESCKSEYSTSDYVREHINYITLKQFLLTYFSDEVCSLYIEEVKNAVRLANDLIGFQTIPHMSLRNLSDFKIGVENNLSYQKVESLVYHNYLSNGRLTDIEGDKLSESDLSIINERLFNHNLYMALWGKEKFAICFITAEYQYSIFKNGADQNFDYTSVAVGYFKSVELLLEKIMWTALEKGTKKPLWIQGNQKIKELKTDYIDVKPNPNGGRLVRFLEKNKKYFSTEMGPLIHWLYYNKQGWLISTTGSSRVKKILSNYNQGCRNEHLHKDLITDIRTLEAIRENTLLCLYYLIGGYAYSGNIEEDTQILGIENTSFIRLYNKLVRMPSRLMYVIQFKGLEPFEARMLFHSFQPEPSYDERGNVKSEILFIKVQEKDDIDYENYETYIERNREKIITLSSDNCPDRMWWRSRSICKEILW